MSVLTRPKLYAQQRVDLEDFEVLFEALRTDSKLFMEKFWTPGQYILKGFSVSGLGGANNVTVNVADSTLVNASNTMCFSWWTAESGATPISVELEPNTRNYLEIELVDQTGTPLTRAFWDQTLLNGEGGEFNETVDTVEEVNVNIVALTGGFSGSPDRIQLAIVDTNLTNTVQSILDRRDNLFRLGAVDDQEREFNWATRKEPGVQLNISGLAGTFEVGETVTLTSGATAEIREDNGTNLVVVVLSNSSILPGDVVTGGTSGATATVDTFLSEFSGADMDITNLKDMLDALMTEIKLLKGTRFWYESAFMSMNGLSSFWNSTLVQNGVESSRFNWTGTELNITDDNVTPAGSDVIAYLRRFGKSGDLGLTRQDATSAPIAIGDGQVMFIKLPASGDRTFTDAGALDTNYQVVNIADFVISDENFWLAYREGSKLYVRGHGELEQGQDSEIGDPASEDLLNYIGADSEADSDPDFTNATGSAIPNNNVVDGENLTLSIKRNDIAIGGLGGAAIQDKNKSLIEGGTFAWDIDADTLSWSADAYISMPGIAKTVNTISAGFVALAADQDVAYVTVNRVGPGGVLTVNTGSMAALTLSADDIIIARRIGTMVLVDESMILGPDELLTLDGWQQEINRYFGQFQIKPVDGQPDRVLITGSVINKLNNSILTQKAESQLLEFEGAQIDFLTGNIYDAAGTTMTGSFTPIALGSAEYGFYSITINPGTIGANNVFPGEVEVVPGAASNAVLADAPRADFGDDGLAIGQVYVQHDGVAGIEDIAFDNIQQLGVGSGGGGGAGSVKVVKDAVEFSADETTITFNEDWTADKTNVKFYRNGILMIKVDAFSTFPGPTGLESFAAEYMEVGTGDINQIAIHPDFPAGKGTGVAETFELCHFQNTFDGEGLAEKFFQSARVDGSGSNGFQATAAVVSDKTRVTLTAFNYNPTLNVGGHRGDLQVYVNGQIVERLIAGVNDQEDNVVYEEDAVGGTFIDVYKIGPGAATEALPADSTIQIFKIQYRVLEMDAFAADLIPASDATYLLGSAGNKWLALAVQEIRSDLIPDLDDTRDLGTALKRWRNLFIADGSIHMVDDSANDFQITMQGGRGGFVQPGEAFKEFGSVDDQAIIGSEGIQSFVKKVSIAAPSTQIQNRALITDFENTIGVNQISETIHLTSLSEIKDESGPNGERVYGLSTGEERVRGYGKWLMDAGSNGEANWEGEADAGSIFEITFWGTALNFAKGPAGGSVLVDVYVDGSLDTAGKDFGSMSTILSSRNYPARINQNVVSGLALGWHTVRLESTDPSAARLRMQSVEIINEVAQLTYNAGTGYSGLTPLDIAAAANLPFKPVAMTGTKGGRVVVYIDPSDGAVKQAFTEAPATASFLGSTDHSDEDVVRHINHFEFGASRADDFSGSFNYGDKGYTLNDNMTALLGDNVANTTQDVNINNANGDSIYVQSSSTAGMRIIFVGTGLDLLVNVNIPSAATRTATVDVDGTSVGTDTVSNTEDNEYVRKHTIASGLPYGTHMIEINTNGSGQSYGIKDFITYQPKKPTLPSGAIILNDYCIPSEDYTFSPAAGTSQDTFMSEGVLFHFPSREVKYAGSGSWTSLEVNNPAYPFGTNIVNTSAGCEIEFEIHGTGFEVFGWNQSQQWFIEVDGQDLTAANFPGITFQGSGFTYNSGLGTIDTPGSGGGVSRNASITGLSLGRHHIKIIGGSRIDFQGFAVIGQPTHMNTPGLNKISNSAIDSREFSFLKETPKILELGKAKAIARFNQFNNDVEDINVGFDTFVDVGNGETVCYFSKPFKYPPVVHASAEEEVSSRVAQVDIIDRHFVKIRCENTNTGGDNDAIFTITAWGEQVDEGEE